MFWQGSVHQTLCPCEGGLRVTIIHDALGHGTYSSRRIPDTGPSSPRTRHGTYPCTTDIWWSSLETCSNLFYCGPTPSQYWHLVVATETCTVCKRAVCILLECILVSLPTRSMWENICDAVASSSGSEINLCSKIPVYPISSLYHFLSMALADLKRGSWSQPLMVDELFAINKRLILHAISK